MMFATTNSRIKTSQLDNCVHRYCKESLQSKLPITVTGLLNIAKYHLNWGKSLYISELKKLLTVGILLSRVISHVQFLIEIIHS